MRLEGLSDLLQLAVQLSGSHTGMGIADIEQKFAVSRRTAQRMIAAICASFPWEEVKSHDRTKRWRLPGKALGGLMGAEVTEMVELKAAARRLREEGAAAGRAEALDRLTAKLQSTMRAADLRRAEPDVDALMEAEGTAIRPGPRPVVAAALLAEIRLAILAFRRMRVWYGANAEAVREHVIEPLGLVHGQRPYLVAQISGATHGPYLFRLDRVRDHTLLPDAFIRDRDFDFKAYTQRSFGHMQEEPMAVHLRFTGSAAAEAAAFHFHPTQVLEQQADGSLHVRFTAGGWREMCQHLVTWEDRVDVLAPATLRQRLSDWARKAADHHARAPITEGTTP